MSPEPAPSAEMDAIGAKPAQQGSADLSSASKVTEIAAAKPETRCGATRSWMAGFVAFFGTGLMAVVSYLDPGNLEADIQIGVGAGFSLLWWTAICCLVFGFTFQCLAGRVGLISGMDLAQQLGARYPKHARILTWILIEIAIIGADIQETIGCAIGIALLTNGAVPLWAGCIIVSFTAFGLLLLERWGFRQLEAVFAAFIAVESICMGINFFQAPIAANDVVRGIFIPRLNSDTIPLAVASLGALVMPYNIYFQSFIVNMHPHDLTSEAKKRTVLCYLRVENFIVLVFAFVINMFVISVFADGFYGVLTEDDVGMESAGDLLGERYGEVYRTLWAIGLLASGQIATIGLTYAGQIVMSGLLNLRVHAGARMMATRLVALIPTVTLAVVFESTGTFDKVAQTLNIVQSLLLPFALIPVVHVAADLQVLGKYRSHPALTVFAGIIATIVSGVNGWILIDFMHTEFPDSSGALAGFTIFIAVYYTLILYFAVGPEHVPGLLQRAQNGVAKATAYVRANTRCRADPGALLEVHH